MRAAGSRGRRRPRRRLRPGALPGAVKAPGPERLDAAARQPGRAPPHGRTDWLHEIKLDGYRTLAHSSRAATVRLITRSGLDWTHRYGDLAERLPALPCQEAVIDGEIVVHDAGGVSRFALLQDALSRGARNELRRSSPSTCCSWTAGPDRRCRSRSARSCWRGCSPGMPTGARRSSSATTSRARGRASTSRSRELGLEGVVSKRRRRAYQPGAVEDLDQVPRRSSRRLRDRRLHRVGGGGRARRRWRSASGSDGELVYRGKVRHRLRCRDAGRPAGAAEAAGGPGARRSPARRRTSVWVRPVLSAQVEYSNLTARRARCGTGCSGGCARSELAPQAGRRSASG